MTLLALQILKFDIVQHHTCMCKQIVSVFSGMDYLVEAPHC